MPFLRFTRDKRGYETTSLVHAIRRQGRSRQRILYWFRTPPDVKVGRPALDEEAIRWIEEHNPDIHFDWQKILEAKPARAAPAEGVKNRRTRRDGPERPRPVPAQGPSESEPIEPESFEVAETAIADSQVTDEEEEVAEAFEQLTHPDAEEQIEAPQTPVEQALGREQLIRLRARYAELQARITERGGDAERIAALRIAAEPLDPDSWVTEEDVRKGLAQFEPKILDLRAALGLRRRRRSRRGGRGRKGERPAESKAQEPERDG